MTVSERQSSPSLRLATAQDIPGILNLVESVLLEYGETICLEPGGAEADMRDLAANYFQPGGSFWVLEQEAAEVTYPGSNGGQIVGTHAAIPCKQDVSTCILKRLYVAKPLRGGTSGQRLMQAAIEWAKKRQFDRIQFWSDTRFERAHRFFEKQGFRKTGEVRQMDDSHQPYREFEFTMALARHTS